jgi:hypothetical protein
MNQDTLEDLTRIIFRLSGLAFLVLFVLDYFQPGFVTNYFNPIWLLILALASGIVLVTKQ